MPRSPKEWIRILNTATASPEASVWLGLDDYAELRHAGRHIEGFNVEGVVKLWKARLMASFRGCAVLVSQTIARGIIFVGPHQWDQKSEKFVFDKTQGKFYLLPGADRSQLPGAEELTFIEPSDLLSSNRDPHPQSDRQV